VTITSHRAPSPLQAIEVLDGGYGIQMKLRDGLVKIRSLGPGHKYPLVRSEWIEPSNNHGGLVHLAEAAMTELIDEMIKMRDSMAASRNSIDF